MHETREPDVPIEDRLGDRGAKGRLKLAGAEDHEVPWGRHGLRAVEGIGLDESEEVLLGQVPADAEEVRRGTRRLPGGLEGKIDTVRSDAAAVR